MSDKAQASEFDLAIDRHAHAENTRREVIKSYYRVRQALGYLGFSLPFLLILSGLVANANLEPSLSDFFHTVSRDIFVGVLFSIGTFLVIYEGYEREPGESFTDNWLATVAGIAVFGVALFPNESPSGQVAAVTQQLVGVQISPIFHYSSCFVFFYCMGHFCMFRFSKTRDQRRRRFYRASRLCEMAEDGEILLQHSLAAIAVDLDEFPSGLSRRGHAFKVHPTIPVEVF